MSASDFETIGVLLLSAPVPAAHYDDLPYGHDETITAAYAIEVPQAFRASIQGELETVDHVKAYGATWTSSGELVVSVSSNVKMFAALADPSTKRVTTHFERERLSGRRFELLITRDGVHLVVDRSDPSRPVTALLRRDAPALVLGEGIRAVAAMPSPRPTIEVSDTGERPRLR